MMLEKVALPLAVDGKSYWEAMILAITNDKFCSLMANFMQVGVALIKTTAR
jgi:hypothetical protein